MTPEEINHALTLKPLWDHLENTRPCEWCGLVITYINHGCDNQTVFAALGLGQQALVGEQQRLKERNGFFNAFDYVRALNWMIVKQPFVIQTNGQPPVIQMR